MFKIEINNISIIKEYCIWTIIEDCKFNIMPNKTYVLLGANGSGKSTLLFALTRLLNPNIFSVNGKVLFNEIDLLNCDLKMLTKIREKNIKYVFQDPVYAFNPLKIFEYYFKRIRASENEINDMLRFFLLPSYNEIKSVFPHEISVGMAQRIAISLAFLAKPNLIIFDEPNSALDIASSNLLALKIKEYSSSGSSALIVTQDLAFAKKIGDLLFLIKDNTVIPLLNQQIT